VSVLEVWARPFGLWVFVGGVDRSPAIYRSRGGWAIRPPTQHGRVYIHSGWLSLFYVKGLLMWMRLVLCAGRGCWVVRRGCWTRPTRGCRR
jgi:hypothetical protein